MSDIDRRDDAVRTLEFRDWLDDQEGNLNDDFCMLFGLFDNAPKAYSFERYSKIVPAAYLDTLVKAEAAWKIDKAAQEASRRSLGIALLPSGEIEKVVTDCGFKTRSGMICGKPAVPGVDRCAKHGGALVDPETRRSILLSAHATIVEGSEKAVEALLDIVEHGRSEIARVQAATQLLDRAGLSADVNINVSVTTVDAGEILRDRLNAVSGKIIEAEVIED